MVAIVAGAAFGPKQARRSTVACPEIQEASVALVPHLPGAEGRTIQRREEGQAEPGPFLACEVSSGGHYG
jgi:hypothetical protein